MFPQIRKLIASLSLQSLPKLTRNLPNNVALFSSSSNPILTAEFLITKHNVSKETALKASSTISLLKNPNRTDSVVSHLRNSGFSETHIDQLITKFPQVLSVNPKLLERKLSIFKEYGFSASERAQIFSNNPWILRRSADNCLRPSIKSLKSIMGSNEAVLKAFQKSVWFLNMDLEKTLLPNVEFLNKSCQISMTQIRAYILLEPRLFLEKPEKLKESARRVIEDMGFERGSKMLLMAIRTVRWMSVENFEDKTRLLLGIGFSEDDVSQLFKRCPQLFCVSEWKLSEAMECLACDTSLVVRHPPLLTYSIEKRLKPRLEVAEILLKKGLLTKNPNVVSFMCLSKKKFIYKYVYSYCDALGADFVTAIVRKMS